MRNPVRFNVSLLAVGLFASACGGTNVLIQSDAQPLSLSDLLQTSDPEVVGITVEPQTGRRFLLERNLGIFELDGDGDAELFLALADFPSPDLAPQSAFTDFVALGDEIFAITARSDGFRLDVPGHTLSQYFCYEPGWEEPVVDQLTDSLAFDPGLGLIYAQPQSFDSGAPEVPIASGLGAYTLDGGQPVAWFEMPDIEMRAGGATVQDDGNLLLVDGKELYRFDLNGEMGTDSSSRLEHLSRLEQVEQVDGMAYDPKTGEVLLVDSSQDLLLSIRITSL